MSELGQNGYLSQISQINSNVAGFRGLKQQAEETQQSLDIQAKQENDMDDLRKIASGFGEKSFKELVGKYGGKLYNSGFGKKGSLSEFDDELGRKLGWTEAEGKDSFLKLVANKLGIDTTPKGAVSDITKNLSNGADKLKSIGSDAIDRASAESSRMTTQVGEKASNLIDKGSGEASNLSEGLAKDALKSNSIKGGEVEMTDLSEDAGRSFSNVMIEEQPQQVSQVGSVNEEPQNIRANVDSSVKANPDRVAGGEDAGQSVAEDAGEGVSEAVGEGVGEAVGEGVGAEAEAVGASAVEEGVGTALEATGVLAPLGLLFQAIGLGTDIYAGVEAGKGVVDAFENDVLGHQTYISPKVNMPKAPNTLLKQHLLVTPTSDTLHQQGTSFSTGW